MMNKYFVMSLACFLLMQYLLILEKVWEKYYAVRKIKVLILDIIPFLFYFRRLRIKLDWEK